MSDILDQPEKPVADLGPKERHGCVTIWLWLMIVANAGTALAYFLASDFFMDALKMDHEHLTLLYVLGVGGVLNVVCAVLLMNWRMIGFYGFIATSILAFVINLIIGLNIIQAGMGLGGIVLLWAVMQFDKNGVKAWDHLE